MTKNFEVPEWVVRRAVTEDVGATVKVLSTKIIRILRRTGLAELVTIHCDLDTNTPIRVTLWVAKQNIHREDDDEIQYGTTD